ncbi:Ig-like domain repeat protein [Nocardia beijingensis]|uniref:Ig-like domain repeat protein n=1 Tax=Nocardia beijingensis TaxID=95162 RepID=UPI001895C7B5|nr:Ig-like domain repeat protein [Nocardia beijingensis]MBF6466903.1 Ig-like domain repeat protein [Nocardia beijingensis]
MRKRVAAVAAAIGAGAAVASAGAAGATVTQVGMYPGINFGLVTNYGTGCTYTARATVTDTVAPVTFYDNGIPFGVVRPSGGVALIDWVPATPGPHTVSAVQEPVAPYVAGIHLRVGEGVHLGYACVVLGG